MDTPTDETRLTLEGDEPLFRQVQRALSARIAAAEWAPGTALPSEGRLAQRFGVSVSTIRAAVAELVTAQVLVRRQGKGTFISPRDEAGSVYRFFQVHPDHLMRELPISRILGLSAGSATDKQVAALGLGARESDRRVWRIRNVLVMNGMPVQTAAITLPMRQFPRLSRGTLQDAAPTLYGALQRLYAVTVVRTEDRVRAVRCPPRVARVLEQPVGAPLLRIDRVAQAVDGSPIEIRQSWIRSDCCHLYYRQGGFD